MVPAGRDHEISDAVEDNSICVSGLSAGLVSRCGLTLTLDTGYRKSVVGEAGLEPTTPGLEGRCSIQLSYSPVSAIVSLLAGASKLHQVSIHR